MANKDDLTVPDKLLLAALELEEKGLRPFSAERLVVSAWQKFPDTFSLAGYREENGELSYPDSNRVFAEIMGSKPIRKRGMLEKVGSKMYQVTEAGHEHAQTLLSRRQRLPIQKASLPREVARELKRLFESKALEKVKSNRNNDLTFYDACAFWRISPRSSAIELEGRLANLEGVVESAVKIVKRKAASFEHGGHAFGRDDLQVLLNVHRKLQERFQEELRIIRKRTDERG